MAVVTKAYDPVDGESLDLELGQAIADLGVLLRSRVNFSVPDNVVQFDITINVDFGRTPAAGIGILIRSVYELERPAEPTHPMPGIAQ